MPTRSTPPPTYGAMNTELFVRRWTGRLGGSYGRRIPRRPLGPSAELRQTVGTTMCPEGIGGPAALRVFVDVLEPATRSQDDPMNLAYVPSAPTRASVAFDFVTSAANVFGGVWETGAGAIFAENEALGWLVELLGWPRTAGGCFVPGGTMRQPLRSRRCTRNRTVPAREPPARGLAARLHRGGALLDSLGSTGAGRHARRGAGRRPRPTDRRASRADLARTSRRVRCGRNGRDDQRRIDRRLGRRCRRVR